jgi:GntR family transcriptional regulator
MSHGGVLLVTASESHNQRRRVPLYERAAQELRQYIVDGRFRDVLPSQDELCEILKVSRSTVREAIRVLERTGLLQSKQGLGTVVNRNAPRFVPGLEVLFSTTELITLNGATPGTVLADLRRTVATPGTYPAFAGETVVVLERVRTANGVPFIYSVDVFPDRDYDLDQLRQHVMGGSLIAWLEARGVEVCYADTTLTAQSASKGLAGRLDVPAGAPLLFMEEVGYGPQDERVFYSHDFYRCDLTRFRIVRRRNLP